jgi:uncharacterized protein YnzC (UPF0291/DUF896 family)
MGKKMDKTKVDRINELAAWLRRRPLNDEECLERQSLRTE